MEKQTQQDAPPSAFAYFIGDERRFPLESRVLNAILFFTTGISFLQFIMVLLLDSPFLVNLFGGLFPPLFGILYALGRRQVLHHNLLSWIYLATVTIAIVVDWKVVGFGNGIALQAILVLFLVIPLFTAGSHSRLAIAFCTLLLLSIFGMEIRMAMHMRETPILHLNMDFVSDRVLTTLIVGVGVSMIVSLVMQTYRKQESEVTRLNQSLQELVDKISEDNKTLKELNTTKDNFFSIIAHDLKNPIGALAALGSKIKRKGSSMEAEDKLRFIEAISNSSISTYGLLEDLLSWAQAESGNLAPNISSIELNRIANDSFNLNEAHAAAKNISLRNNIPLGLRAAADKSMTNTIFRNLIGNAIKFTKPGGYVSASAVRKGDIIEIQIQDNGVGIPKEQMDTLFDLKALNTSTGTLEESGSGLGLRLCKKFVEAQGGKISATGDNSTGTTIAFSLSATNS